MQTLLRPCVFAIIFFLHFAALAKDVTFGAEFTFTNDKIIAGARSDSTVHLPEAAQARDQFRDRVLQVCQGCYVVEEKNGYKATVHKIVYPDGWYFIIATDPSVVEVQTKPLTVAEYKKMRERIQTDIFDAAKTVGITPHAHMGVDTFILTFLPLLKEVFEVAQFTGGFRQSS